MLTQDEALTKMAAYVRYLAGKIPVGNKAAELEGNLRKASRLSKLAQEIAGQKDLFKAVDTVYSDKSANYRHQVINGLVKGFGKKLAEARKQAMGMGYGASSHPSAGVTGQNMPAGPNGVPTKGPQSMTA